MTRKGLFMLLGSVCLALMLVIPAVASCAAPTPTPTPALEYQWRMGVPFTRPIENPSYALFSDLIEVYSDGRIEVEVYPDGLLGGHDEIFHAVQEGSVEIGVVQAYANVVPGGVCSAVPWGVTDYDEGAVAFSAPDGILYQVMSKAYEEVGMQYLWNLVRGSWGFANNVRPLKSPADFKNLKMRVSAAQQVVMIYENMSKGTGMTLETIPWVDLYNALERRVVDAIWASWPSLIDERHVEVLKYYTPLNTHVGVQYIVMNQAKWDALPKDLQDAISRASEVAQFHVYESLRRAEKDYEKEVVAYGVEVYYPTDEERAAFKEASNIHTVWEELVDPWLEKAFPGQNMSKVMRDELARIAAEY